MAEEKNYEHMYLEGAMAAVACPFCGSESVVMDDYRDEEVYEVNYACEECGAYAIETYRIQGTNWYRDNDDDE